MPESTTPPETKPQRIIRLAVNNIMRISAAEVRPDGNPLVIVAGRNSQGKTSLLDSIAIALSGKDLPAQPIKRGEATASVILETDELIVTRTFSQTGGAKLEVRDRNNEKVTQPQTKLDLLFSKTTFDPLTFANSKPLDQANTVRRIAGLDFTADDAEHAKIFEERTAVGRDLRAAQARRDQHRRTDAPEEEVSLSDLAEKLENGQETNRGIDRRLEIFARMEEYEGNCKTAVDEAQRAVEAAQLALEGARAELEQASANVVTTKAEVANLEKVDTAAIRQQMAEAEETNVKVRANQAFRTEHTEVVRLQGAVSELTGKLDAIAKRKQDALGAAKFPIDGLAFNDAGVTFNGVPFDQASSAERIRVSLAIACALNPNLRVMLIRDGSLLDEESVALIAEYAAEHGAQVFMECVGNRDDATVIIEDGHVTSTPAADAKKADTKKPGKADPKTAALKLE
jgi:hypothetical protein